MKDIMVATRRSKRIEEQKQRAQEEAPASPVARSSERKAKRATPPVETPLPSGNGISGKKSTKWMLWLAVVLGLLQVACKQCLDLPLEKLLRNVFMAPQPPPVTGKYTCDAASIAQDVTVVVTVKDACSQAPGFIRALNDMMPTKGVHLIYTFPNFSSCAGIPGMEDELRAWEARSGKVTTLPLPPRVSPM